MPKVISINNLVWCAKGSASVVAAEGVSGLNTACRMKEVVMGIYMRKVENRCKKHPGLDHLRINGCD